VTSAIDAAQQPITVQDVRGISTRNWDRAGRLVGTVDGLGQALTYSLAVVDERISMVDGDGERTLSLFVG
jgi:YD repeat-containing protein